MRTFILCLLVTAGFAVEAWPQTGVPAATPRAVPASPEGTGEKKDPCLDFWETSAAASWKPDAEAMGQYPFTMQSHRTMGVRRQPTVGASRVVTPASDPVPGRWLNDVIWRDPYSEAADAVMKVLREMPAFNAIEAALLVQQEREKTPREIFALRIERLHRLVKR